MWTVICHNSAPLDHAWYCCSVKFVWKVLSCNIMPCPWTRVAQDLEGDGSFFNPYWAFFMYLEEHLLVQTWLTRKASNVKGKNPRTLLSKRISSLLSCITQELNPDRETFHFAQWKDLDDNWMNQKGPFVWKVTNNKSVVTPIVSKLIQIQENSNGQDLTSAFDHVYHMYC